MLRKALIVTLFGNYNYGNKFQNYALQKVLERFEFEVYTLNLLKIKRKDLPQISFIKRLKKLTPKKVTNKMKLFLYKNINKEREKVFFEFSNSYIKTYEYVSDKETNDLFDKICLGSDQIWKPLSCDSHFAYAHFAEKEKVFSYAASFGISEIKEEHKEMVARGLKNVSNISTREERGIEIVKELSGEEAELLVDPTMLLTSEEWDEISKNPTVKPEKDFILTYFLGEYSFKRRSIIKKIAKENNWEIVDLGKANLKKYYCASPSEFLYFVKNAKVVFTDSFHGAVFSILYKKPFYVLERMDLLTSMTSRIETLLNKFSFENRKIEMTSSKNIRSLDLNVNFDHVDEILKKEREKSDKYLRKALNTKENELEN